LIPLDKVILDNQRNFVYGPILSRRLGRSLGINLSPKDLKLCSFNCVYCEYGPTTNLALNPSANLFPKSNDVLLALKKVLLKPYTLDHVTFSGNGEPTLHPDFLEIVTEVIELVIEYKPGANVALFSNSSTLNRRDVVEAIKIIDRPFLKLDAGNAEVFWKINQPMPDLNFNEIINNLEGIHNLIIQTAFISGDPGNTSEQQIQDWLKVIKKINPQEVQLYRINRPAWHPNVIAYDKLEVLAKEIRRHTELTINFYK
jgi:wyosine [tRNA(Phe)-imidazoG37] synthetase (radical SAM superfamily)